MSNAARLELIVLGGLVKRYHAKPVLTNETVGHHSFLVAWLCVILYDVLYGSEVPQMLLIAALQHDLPECVTGDVPAPAKRRFDIGGQFEAYEGEVFDKYGHDNITSLLSEKERGVLKRADCIAGIIHCIHERRMGNTYIESTFKNYLTYLDGYAFTTNEYTELINHLKGQWNECK